MLLVLLKMPLANAKNVQLRRRREKFDIFFENSVVLRISPQSLAKEALAFSKSVAALTVTHPRV